MAVRHLRGVEECSPPRKLKGFGPGPKCTRRHLGFLFLAVFVFGDEFIEARQEDHELAFGAYPEIARTATRHGAARTSGGAPPERR